QALLHCGPMSGPGGPRSRGGIGPASDRPQTKAEVVSAVVLDCIAMADDPREIVRRHLADPASRWSVGTYGAIGEFDYDAGEAGLTVDLERLSVGTTRGS